MPKKKPKPKASSSKSSRSSNNSSRKYVPDPEPNLDPPPRPVGLTEPDQLDPFDLRDGLGRVSRSPLKNLILHQQPVYRRLLALIRGGAHPVVAGASVGIPPNMIRAWIESGRKARSGLYFHFWSDITLAIARTVAEASEEIRIKTPEKWLATGPATEVFDPTELPVLGFQDQPGSHAGSGQSGININILNSEHIPQLADAFIELKRVGISLDAPPEPPPDPKDKKE